MINLNRMTAEEYFEEWWTPKEIPENGFNKTAMLDFAEGYHEHKLKILGIEQVDVNAKWECCKCGWIGTHNESADKTPVVNDAWLLICPKCGNKDEFYACR